MQIPFSFDYASWLGNGQEVELINQTTWIYKGFFLQTQGVPVFDMWADISAVDQLPTIYIDDNGILSLENQEIRANVFGGQQNCGFLYNEPNIIDGFRNLYTFLSGVPSLTSPAFPFTPVILPGLQTVYDLSGINVVAFGSCKLKFKPRVADTLNFLLQGYIDADI